MPRPLCGCGRRTRSWARGECGRSCAERGVPARVAQAAIDARYTGTNEEALAREHLERKRIGKPTTEKETARVVRRLVAAGFSTGTIYKVLRQWDVAEEELAALDQMEPETHGE